MDRYLKATDVIDWEHESVRRQAIALRGDASDPDAIARACFEWVRDEIRHSGDHRLHEVTCSASEVLEVGSGYCYAKSHLLVGLLRANGLSAGMCYQRMSVDDVGQKYCLHGLAAVKLPGYGWYRMDARGNKPGVDAQFVPPVEKLAFELSGKGEATLPEIWPDPMSVVVEALRMYMDAQILGENLPDIDLWIG